MKLSDTMERVLHELELGGRLLVVPRSYFTILYTVRFRREFKVTKSTTKALLARECLKFTGKYEDSYIKNDYMVFTSNRC